MKLCLNIVSRTLAGLILSASAGVAQAVIIATDATYTDVIPGVANFQTNGATMDGMLVTAMFQSGFSETLSWADTGPVSGGVAGNGWSLTVSGDTFGTSWQFTNSRGVTAIDGLSSLTLDGRPGLTLFDRTDPSPGTPGSFNGWDFIENPVLAGTATYSHIVAIGTAAPLGDLWQQLDVVFDNPVGSFTFIQDTDNDSRFGVPLPGTLVMLGIGLIGLSFGRRPR